VKSLLIAGFLFFWI